MTVWTIQPRSALDQINSRGAFRCDPNKSYNISKPDTLKYAYEWLMGQMEEKIGAAPAEVKYPIWAWHTWNFERKCPDPDSAAFLKRDTEKVLLTLDIPENELVLSDYDAWQGVMLDSYVPNVRTEEEYTQIDEWLDGLSEDRLREEIHRSWENIFLIDRVESEFLVRGRYIQATFWEIRKEYVREARTLPPNM